MFTQQEWEGQESEILSLRKPVVRLGFSHFLDEAGGNTPVTKVVRRGREQLCEGVTWRSGVGMGKLRNLELLNWVFSLELHYFI